MKRKYLVVVDMQNDFTTGVLGNPETAAVAARVAETIKKWRNENPDGRIIATFDTHTENYMDTQEGKNLPVPHCIDGTDGWELDPAVAEALGEDIVENYVRVKKVTFGSRALPGYIDDPIDITLVGVCTGICVISNAMLLKAFFPETPINVIADSCACVTPESHKTALDAMKLCQINIL